MTLEQIKGKHKKVFKLDETGVLISMTAKGKLPNEEHIPFENIKSDRFSYTSVNYTYLLGTGICLMIFTIAISSRETDTNSNLFAMVLWGSGSLLFTIFFFVHRTTAYFLKTFNGKYIRFLHTKDKTQIEEFIQKTITKRNEYLRFKYANPIPYLDYEMQHINLGILLREKIISRDEYEKKIIRLKEYFQHQSSSNDIDFTKN